MENKQLNIDAHDIELTASVRQVTKFRIFELAYQDWYGEQPAEAAIEACFIAYLCDGDVPCWVRAYTRKTLRQCEEAGRVLPKPPADKPGTVMAINAETLLLLAGLVVLTLAQLL